MLVCVELPDIVTTTFPSIWAAVTSILMIIIGLFLISGLLKKLIGLFIIGYSITEIVNYIYFKSKNKDMEPIKKESKKIKNKRLKEPKVVDAVIEEDTRQD